jgi:hypothetical protein
MPSNNKREEPLAELAGSAPNQSLLVSSRVEELAEKHGVPLEEVRQVAARLASGVENWERRRRVLELARQVAAGTYRPDVEALLPLLEGPCFGEEAFSHQGAPLQASPLEPHRRAPQRGELVFHLEGDDEDEASHALEEPATRNRTLA